jgi:hypothetical protein
MRETKSTALIRTSREFIADSSIHQGQALKDARDYIRQLADRCEELEGAFHAADVRNNRLRIALETIARVHEEVQAGLEAATKLTDSRQ